MAQCIRINKRKVLCQSSFNSSCTGRLKFALFYQLHFDETLFNVFPDLFLCGRQTRRLCFLIVLPPWSVFVSCRKFIRSPNITKTQYNPIFTLCNINFPPWLPASPNLTTIQFAIRLQRAIWIWQPLSTPMAIRRFGRGQIRLKRWCISYWNSRFPSPRHWRL
jgi:hypothetical protein